MLAKTYTAQTYLLKGVPITVEVDLSGGLYAFSVVGLPDKAVEEARDRVNSALKNTGFESPKDKNGKTTVSLSPADIKKEGSGFDLAIALAYLLATEQINFDTEKKLFLGELSLGGDIKSVRGVLPIIRAAKEAGFEEIYVPEENINEATLVNGVTLYKVKTLKDVVNHLTKNGETLTPTPHKVPTEIEKNKSDMCDIRGQENVKRGLEIAAAGGHNIALSGPPGTGKTLLAKAFASILPTLDIEEILEIASIHSVAGVFSKSDLTSPPFRAPHHSSSYVSVIGGGATPRPGEATLAHRGVLFLDEFPEFDKRVIESLRQPLEDGQVTIARAKGSATFPANFMLVAAMNPCPCGYKTSKDRRCRCSASDISRYERKLSGPIMDRIDIALEVGPVSYSDLDNKTPDGEKSEEIRNRVIKARTRQKERFAGAKHLRLNSDMGARDLSAFVEINDECKKLLHESASRLKLSARAYHRVLKLARTIADLAQSDEIKMPHILEALSYRPKTSF